MSQTNQPKPSIIARFRWLYFALAMLAILDTPFAVINAFHSSQPDHRLNLILIYAFAMRFVWIGLFFSLWWRHRPRAK